jgi:lysophospholipase L1-like esterase
MGRYYLFSKPHYSQRGIPLHEPRPGSRADSLQWAPRLQLRRKDGQHRAMNIAPLPQDKRTPEPRWGFPGRAAAYLLYLFLATGFSLLLVEAGLRMFLGLPAGLYNIQTGDGRTLYRPGTAIHMVWAPIPYTMGINSLGLRGREIPVPKTPGRTRVVCLGDSITDGFYADNEDTYPRRMELALQAAGHEVEVLTVAEGDSSIDRQMELYRRYAAPLAPDIVVLVGLSNDIDNLRGKTLPQILHKETPVRDIVGESEWLLFARTAVGELILDWSLRATVPKYRHNRAAMSAADRAQRYVIPGGEDRAANLAAYAAVAQRTDGLIAYDEFSPEQEATVAQYVAALQAFHDELKAQGVRLYFVYFPEYPEVYDPARHFPLSARMQAGCAAAGIPFLNLTPAFQREAAQGAVLYLGPLDFHPNPTGYGLIGAEVAQWLAAALP